ncbi:unnamed protein product, partial [Sphacelaria rigidula]
GDILPLLQQKLRSALRCAASAKMTSFSRITAAGGAAALLMSGDLAPTGVDAHIYMVESRQYFYSPVYQSDDFKNLEHNAGAYNAGGQATVQERALRL